MKTCPFCAEDVKAAAIVCKHCLRDLPIPVPPRMPSAPTSPAELFEPVDGLAQQFFFRRPGHPDTRKKNRPSWWSNERVVAAAAIMLFVVPIVVATNVPAGFGPKAMDPTPQGKQPPGAPVGTTTPPPLWWDVGQVGETTETRPYTCGHYDPDDANALITSDDGSRYIDGQILSAVLVDTGQRLPATLPLGAGAPMGVLVLNVDNTLYSWAIAIDGIVYFALDGLTADAALLPQSPIELGLDHTAVDVARECAARGLFPPAPDIGGEAFDEEAWRAEAVGRFGEEERYTDGSRFDYVDVAQTICELSASDRATMEANLGARYQGSVQQFISDTYCPFA